MPQDTMTTAIAFVVYLGLMLAIGFLAYRRMKSLSDYALGGRRLGPFPVAVSAGASDMSGWLMLGLPGYALIAGFEATWIVIGLLVGTWLNWLLVARRLRVYSAVADDALTLPTYFSNRFRDGSNRLRVASSLFTLFFFLFYVSAGLVAQGKLFEAVFDISYTWAVCLGAIVIVIYVFLGGFLAVSWTDVVQALMIAFALALVSLHAMGDVGGWHEVTLAMQDRSPAMLDMWTDAQGNPLSALTIISLLAWGLGYFGQPHILARFKAIRDDRQVATARRIAVSWTFIVLSCALLTGWVAQSYLDTSPKDVETVFIELTHMQFSPLLTGMLLTAVLAAIMSTADSQLLASASIIAEDVYRPFVRPKASAKELILVGRLSVAVLAFFAVLLALNSETSVLQLVAYAWAGFGAAFGPTVLLSLYWRRMTRSGALSGILVGGITVVIWKHLDGGIFDLYEIIPGFILATIAIFVVSLLTQAPEAFTRHAEAKAREDN
ncbi:sodium/proline symporter PutP [Pokkaliibacter sp. CJK22405]|uniref:sodium/proline symporter PutP n=1 Tax=Pokkaliibacter sp. CJK22405 TaxID=3384615 RepID=UPI003984ADE2